MAGPSPFALAADLLDPQFTAEEARWAEHGLSPYIPRDHFPHPPQLAFHNFDGEEGFYGGAAGGGKSDTKLMCALKYVDVPGYAALILRKTYSDLALPGAIMDRAKDWLIGNTDATWNDNDKTFTFPSTATLTFGYLQTANDKYRYQGAEFQYIGFDELTQFDEVDYLYLRSRLRRPSAGPLSLVPLRLRGAANPGGRGHRWVKRRFIDKKPNPDDPQDTQEKCDARLFVPAKLDDNPSVDREAYVEQLTALDPQTRKQLMDGDWNAREPGDWVFPIGLDEVFELGARYDQQRTDDKMPPPVGEANVLASDYGTHTHMLLLWPLEGGGFYAAKEIVYEHRAGANVRHMVPSIDRAVRELGWPIRQMRFDASQPVLNEAFMERLNEVLPWKVTYLAVPFGKFKTPTIDYLKLLVANTLEHVRNGRATTPMLAVSERHCPVLADQLRGWQYSDVDLEKIDKHDDHGPDALISGAAPEAAKRRRSAR